MSSALVGKKLLITREQSQAEELKQLLVTHQAEPIVTPLLRFDAIPFQDGTALLSEIRQFDWIFFTSANTVHFFHQLTKAKPSDIPKKIAAVGEKTAKALQEYGYHTDFIPTRYNGETLVHEFYEQYGRASIAYLCGEKARREIPDLLHKYGINFKKIVLYRTIKNDAIEQKLIQVVKNEKLDAILFTSPSTVEAFCDMVPDAILSNIKEQYLVAAIGTTTANTLHELKFQHVIFPEKFTIEAMVHELATHFFKKNR